MDAKTSKKNSTAIVWFRRDLRVADNPALATALAEYDRVIPLWVWDPALTRPSGPARLAFLGGCLDDLGRSLRHHLIVRTGDPQRMVPEAAQACDACEVFVSADFAPYGRVRDQRVAEALQADGRALRAVGSPYAVDPGLVRKGDGGPFQVFTPFYKAWRSRGWDTPIPMPRLDRLTGGGLASHPGPDLPAGPDGLMTGGEDEAHRRLDRFLGSAVGRYDDERDRPDLDTTSRLSPYLRFGCLHPRQILDRLDLRQRSHERYQSELCWREFYADVLLHRPDAARRAYRPEFRAFPVDTGEDADARFEAWTQGRTGFPLVDAGMRQLLGEGWMHNRVRMVVASFLVKDLHVDWGRGARWFMTHLVDGDLASNQLNWQWVAGCGTDAAPYFRIFNPTAQGQKFDPHGRYIRRWVPELRDCPDEYIHDPGCSIFGAPACGSDTYPAPIVDHGTERQEALSRYAKVKSSRPA